MTQKQFYKTPAWRRARDAYIAERKAIDGGLCEICQTEPGLVVHHIVWLDDVTCNDPGISLNADNFRFECQACHNREIDPRKQTPGRVRFDGRGNVILQDLPPSREKI